MTRKHFQLIADVLAASNPPPKMRLKLAEDFAVALRSTNPGFKPEQFIRAATDQS